MKESGRAAHLCQNFRQRQGQAGWSMQVICVSLDSYVQKAGPQDTPAKALERISGDII